MEPLPSSLEANGSHCESRTPLKLAIKSNFACREIKQGFGEGWHQPPKYPSVVPLHTALYYRPSLFSTFSLPIIQTPSHCSYELQAEPSTQPSLNSASLQMSTEL